MSQLGWLARGSRQRWIAVRGLACLGAMLLTLASWLPWVAVSFAFPDESGRTFTDLLPGTLFPLLFVSRSGPRLGPRTYADASLLWTVLLFGGILLALTLWQRTSARLARLSKRVHGLWLLVMTLLTLLSVWLSLTFASWAGPSYGDLRIVHINTVTGAGFWLALAALASLWGSAYLMMGEPRIQQRTGRLAASRSWRRSRAQLVGLGTLLAGILLWGLGYIALPWATVNCKAPRLSLTHYLDGVCAGVDSGDTLMALVGPHLPPTSMYTGEAMLLIYTLLAGSALLLLAGAGRSAYTRGFCGWVLAWLLAATAMALVSYRGVAVVVANPPILGAAAVGVWHGDLGIVLTLAGLLSGWASLIPLEAAGLAQATAMREPMREDALSPVMRG
ncbi:MAG TPA: hypothetical protein VKQ30_22360 [Ktedonobacterales bacterium]|nr:hypothetical protein [Ktedonobacterales bacterium]